MAKDGAVTRQVCGATMEGPKAPGTRSARMWRRTCKAAPMRDRAELVGFVPGRCFQHQPSEVRNAVYAARRREDIVDAETASYLAEIAEAAGVEQ